MEETQKDILAELITDPQLIQANAWKRLANFLIDYFVYYALIFCVFVLWYIINPGALREEGGNNFSVLIVSLVLYILYYSLIEMLTKGRSIGKLITGTKVVNEDGSNISIGTAFKRSLSRLVPFEPFSALGSPSYPWHDRWNRTYVIDIKKTSVLSDATYDSYGSSTAL